jgi:hypothetical protein
MTNIIKTCLIRQPAGLGDIFFTQKIAKEILNNKKADRVIWPVIKEYSYLSEYLLGENISYINEIDSFPFKDVYQTDPQCVIDRSELLYLPVQHADRFISTCPVMQAKYKFLDISYHDWKDFFEFKRNPEREKYLIEYLNMDFEKPFNLVNNSFGSKNYSYLNNRISIKIENEYKNVVMDYLNFDNIFDWIGLIDKATEIHTVDTVWCYLLEKLGKQNVTVYSRNKNEKFFNYVKGIFNPEWTYIL